MSDQAKEPTLIPSRHNGPFTKDGITLDVQIYRLTHTKWTLEVVAPDNTSIVWDDEFETDDEAYAELLRTIAEDGITSLLRDADTPLH